ncbi:hypothetical protein QYE76_062012 [Lolium multiflorum]|uniref:Uncharacterized protein n=1 Tax=Lolium multiflorum TaxID=4521 RepID=A0AAD8W805_LOLMU|nr:hypothetical protein QYE76_062012 [Lolium multiflorum]
MENYSLLMGAAALMKMAVKMAAVSMEKPSGGTSPSGGVPEQRLLSPGSWLAMAAALEGYADKPPFKPLPPKEGNEEKEKKKKKGTKKKKKKKKKKENKEKEAMAYPRVYEVTIGNRKYVAPNDYYDNESEYDDLPMPCTHVSDHDLDEHTTFDIGNLFGTDYEKPPPSRNQDSGDRSLCSGTPPGRGIAPGVISTAVSTAIFTAIAVSMMRRE